MDCQLGSGRAPARRADKQFDFSAFPAHALGYLARLLVVLSFCLLPRFSWADEQAIALINGRVVTMTDQGAIEPGTVLVVDGKIAAVGSEVAIPAGAKVIDCTGWTITPGLIDARSRLWLENASAGQSGGDAALDAYDGLDRFQDDWREVVRHGVTAVYVQPAGGDVCAGVGVVVAAAPGNNPAAWILRRDAGMQAALGVGADLSGRGRVRQFDRLKKLFSDAKKYQDDWAAYREYEKKKSESAPPAQTETPPDAGEGRRDEGPPPGGGRRSGRGGRGAISNEGGTEANNPPAQPPPQEPAESPAAEEAKPPTKPDHDPVKERFVRVLSGEVPVRIDVRHGDEARRLLLLAKEFPAVRWICEGLVGTGTAADDLRGARYPLVLGPWIGNDQAARDVVQLWRQSFREDTGRLVIASYTSSGRGSRWLRAHAACAVAAGCDPETALRAITVHAADVLGVADQVGSIAPGKRADLVVFAGDPLDISAPAQLTIVAGDIVYELPRRNAPIAVVVRKDQAADLPDEWPEQFVLSSSRVLLPSGQIAPRCLTIEKGRITRCDETLAEDNQWPVFDVGSHLVAPGLTMAHTTAGMVNADYGAVESDGRQLAALDGFNSTHRNVRRLRSGGVLLAVIAPDDRITLAGRMGTVRLAMEVSVVNSDVGDKVVLTSAARRSEQFPASLLGQIELTHAMFTGNTPASRMYLPEPVQAALMAVRQAETQNTLGQQRWVLFEVGTDAEMQVALDIIQQHQLRAAVMGCRNIEPFIDRLLATKTTLIARPSGETDFNWYFDDLAGAADAGVPILWSADSAQQLRWLLAEAIAAGVDVEKALAGATTAGAGWLGFDPHRVGLHPGAPADFVIWDGLPTDLRSRPIRVTVDGRAVETVED